jgi:imidazolonepropionase-like amidohydrolase
MPRPASSSLAVSRHGPATSDPPFPTRAAPAGLVTITLALAACAAPADTPTPPPPAYAFTGATLWDGTGAPAIPNAVLLVREGRIEAVGSADDIEIPSDATRQDLSGHWIVPGLINAHGHVGQARGLESGAAAHTRENIEDQLALYARYGVTTVVSLGEPGYVGVEVRDAQAAPEATAALDQARLFVAGIVMDPETPDEARTQVAERAEEGVDWAKIRVDDGLGQREAMSRPTYAAAISGSRGAGLPLTAHMVYLEDAKGLAREGAAVLGHSVRDEPVDRELIDLMLAADICLHPTLTREVSTFIYADRPEIFDDPFFLKDADPSVLAELQTPERQAGFTGTGPDWYRDQLPTATRNMTALHDAGVRIAFGTDSGPPARFQGYFEHMELEMMQEAGMSPADILRSATGVAADCMELDGVGTLVAGAWADFVVVRADPLDDVRNLRQIEEVRIAGNAVPGARFDGR